MIMRNTYVLYLSACVSATVCANGVGTERYVACSVEHWNFASLLTT